MKRQKGTFIIFTSLLLFTMNVFAQDPNFHIYICFGQSNMEGQGEIEEQDKTVNSRFQVIQALDCSNLNREKGEWYCCSAVMPMLYRVVSCGLFWKDYD
ncbi:sialate O-acetylesterase [Yeosuana sp. AK3]